MEKRKKISMLVRAADVFDLPAEALTNLPKVTIVATSRAVVENHTGLMEYSENQIIVAGGRVAVRILGDKLELRAMNTYELLITGTIFTVEFVE